MIKFEKKFFRKVEFTEEEIRSFFEGARYDLEIAQKDPFPAVQFTYSFQALIKAGIALIAREGGVKVRSVPGHHAKILEKMSEILNDPKISKVGDAMRVKRNTGFYGGGSPIGEKEAKDYVGFAESVIQKVEEAIREGGRNG